MERPARITVQDDDGAAVLTGDWTAAGLGDAGAALAAAVADGRAAALDLTQIRRMDTAGAFAVIRATRDRMDASHIRARPEGQKLLDLGGIL